ncbi:ABC transporter substrate-binding protein [Chryseobacterium sp. T1]
MKKINYITLTIFGLLLFQNCNEKKVNNQTDKNAPFHQKFTSYDMDGKAFPQSLNKVPERVVINNLSCTEIFLELGLKDKIVGILQLDNKPNGKWKKELEQLKVIGDKMQTNKEMIASYQPDIFIGSGRGMNEAFQGSIDNYNQLGIPVYSQLASINHNSPTFKTIIEDVKNLGKIMNVEEKSEAYATELQKKYDNILEKVKSSKTEKQLSILAIYSMDIEKKMFGVPIISTGLQYDIIKTLNLKPAVDGFSNNNTFEHLIKMNPDIIIYILTDRMPVSESDLEKYFFTDPLIKDVSAIKNKRIIGVQYDDFLDYGARNFDTLERLYQEIYEKR